MFYYEDAAIIHSKFIMRAVIMQYPEHGINAAEPRRITSAGRRNNNHGKGLFRLPFLPDFIQYLPAFVRHDYNFIVLLRYRGAVSLLNLAAFNRFSFGLFVTWRGGTIPEVWSRFIGVRAKPLKRLLPFPREAEEIIRAVSSFFALSSICVGIAPLITKRFG
jgi:hypothetical protein